MATSTVTGIVSAPLTITNGTATSVMVYSTSTGSGTATMSTTPVICSSYPCTVSP